LSFGTKAYLNPVLAFGQGDDMWIWIIPELILSIVNPWAYSMGTVVDAWLSGKDSFFNSLQEKKHKTMEIINGILISRMNKGNISIWYKISAR
jgi:hypothetical protein